LALTGCVDAGMTLKRARNAEPSGTVIRSPCRVINAGASRPLDDPPHNPKPRVTSAARNSTPKPNPPQKKARPRDEG